MDTHIQQTLFSIVSLVSILTRFHCTTYTGKATIHNYSLAICFHFSVLREIAKLQCIKTNAVQCHCRSRVFKTLTRKLICGSRTSWSPGKGQTIGIKQKQAQRKRGNEKRLPPPPAPPPPHKNKIKYNKINETNKRKTTKLGQNLNTRTLASPKYARFTFFLSQLLCFARNNL